MQAKDTKIKCFFEDAQEHPEALEEYKKQRLYQQFCAVWREKGPLQAGSALQPTSKDAHPTGRLEDRTKIIDWLQTAELIDIEAPHSHSYLKESPPQFRQCGTPL